MRGAPELAGRTTLLLPAPELLYQSEQDLVVSNLAESYFIHGSNIRPNQVRQPALKLLQRRSSYLGFFSPGQAWLRAVDLDATSGEELRPGLGSVLWFWLSSSKINLLIVMRLFLGCSSELPSPSAGDEFAFSFSSFLGLLVLRAGDDGGA